MANRKLRAFTMLELLTALGIFLGISILVLPYTIEQLQTNKGEAAMREMSSSFFRQQQDAFASKGNSDQGIAFFNNKYAVFAGNSYASATSKDDIIFSSSVTISNISLTGGATEVVFAKGTLTPSATGTVTLSDGYNNFVLTINTFGMSYFTKL